MSVLGTVADAATGLVDSAGDAGLAVVMAVEAVLPVPSEVVLPLVGTQVAAGQLSYPGAVLAATLGSTLGAWVVLLGRLVPGVRVLVNLPAGSLGMPTVRFLALTAAGSAVWNAAWIGAGSTLVTYGDAVLAAVADARPATLLAVAVGLVVVLARQTRVRAVFG